MREKLSSMRRFGFVLAGTLALVMIWGSASAWAQDADDEELPADTKFFRKLFKEFGLQREGEGVEFRERAPLVVPPSRELPPPQSADAVTRNPAWPKDPDAKQRNVAVSTPAQRARLRGAAEAMEEEGRALRPNELNIGTGPASTGSVQNPDESARPDDAVAAWQQGLSRLLHEQVVRPGNRGIQQRAPANKSDRPARRLPDPVGGAALRARTGQKRAAQAERPLGSGSRELIRLASGGVLPLAVPAFALGHDRYWLGPSPANQPETSPWGVTSNSTRTYTCPNT